MHIVSVKEKISVVISRAENKLAGAVSAFSYDFRGKIVLDIGSSTGGFTEYVINAGARKVIAVEKGTRQMKEPLRFSKKVELHEKTNIFNVTSCETLDGASEVLIEQPDVIVADVSFVSLKKVLEYVKKRIANKNTDLLVMLKPQFEARGEQLHRGIVKNEKIRRQIILDFEQWLKMAGFLIVKKHDNELKGRNGNKERFYYLKLAKS